jgi:hypothetical protein
MECIAVFGKAKCWILLANIPHKALAFGVQDAENGSYKLEASTLHKLQHKSLSLFLIKQLSNVELWHKRMGHISFQRLHKLSKPWSSKGMPYMYQLLLKVVMTTCLGNNTKKLCQRKTWLWPQDKTSFFTLICVDHSNTLCWEDQSTFFCHIWLFKKNMDFFFM